MAVPLHRTNHHLIAPVAALWLLPVLWVYTAEHHRASTFATCLVVTAIYAALTVAFCRLTPHTASHRGTGGTDHWYRRLNGLSRSGLLAGIVIAMRAADPTMVNDLIDAATPAGWVLGIYGHATRRPASQR